DLAPTRKMVEEYKRRRDVVFNLLKEIPGIKANYPQGAFYFFPDVSSYYGKSADSRVINTGDDLCMYLLETANVSLVPGAAFGEEKCVRLSYAASENELREAIQRMKNALSKLS
ncbi:MAG: aminotransferase class I/II-fold pyridoxal phosphate-dependent enzyme, partial [Flammeovirgaceae bacterium]|nr:aminotransferase class I/II-fold pyridoxal phosphate-dependent enzyme [Flammeovirgaceae bacterium]